MKAYLAAAALMGSIALAAIFGPQTAFADRIWDNDDGTFLWTDANNWNPNSVPFGPADNVQFQNVGTGTTTQSGAGGTIFSLYYFQTAGTHTTDLSGNTLTLNNGSQFFVAPTNGSSSGNGTVILQNGSLNTGSGGDWRITRGGGGDPNQTNSLVIGTSTNPVVLTTSDIGRFWVGRYEGASPTVDGTADFTYATGTFDTIGGEGMQVGMGTRATGTVTFGSNLDVTIGDAGNRSDVRIGQHEGANAVGNYGNGSVTKLGGTMNMNLSRLWVGRSDGDDATSNGVLDMSAAVAGNIEVAGAEVYIGSRGDASGNVTFGSGQVVSLGISGNRTALRIGYTEGAANNVAGTVGTLAKTGGSFNVYANDLFLAHNASGGSAVGSATANLNLGAGVTGTINVSGGNSLLGYGRNATANITIPAGVDLTLGLSGARTDFRVGEGENSSTNVSTSGSLTKSSGNVNMQHSNFIVGRNEVTNNGAVSGVVDFSGTATGSIKRQNGDGGGAQIGRGGNATGTVTLGGNMSLEWGSTTERYDVRIGEATQASNTAVSGTLTRSANGNGTIEMHTSNFFVGYNGANAGTATGSVDLTGAGVGSAYDQQGSSLYVGVGRNAIGSLNLSSANLATNIGDPANRTQVQIGDGLGHEGGTAATGTLTKTSGTFNFAPSNLYIGYNNAGTGPGASGLLDSTGSMGTINTTGNQFWIGFGRAAVGEFKMGSGLNGNIGENASRADIRVGEANDTAAPSTTSGKLTKSGGTLDIYAALFRVGRNETNNNLQAATGEVDLIGTSGSINIEGSSVDIGVGRDTSGTVKFGAGFTSNFGIPANRTSIYVGDANSRVGTINTTGTLQQTAGTINWLPANLRVGMNEHNSGTGVIGLTNIVGAGGGIDMQGFDLSVGLGYNAVGTLQLGGATQTNNIGIAANRTFIRVGDRQGRDGSVTTSGTLTQTSGVLNLTPTSFYVGVNDGNLGAATTGTVNVTGSSGTLDMQGHNLYVGFGREVTGILNLGGASYSATIGSTSNRTDVRIGDGNTRLGTNPANGTVVKNAGLANLNPSNLIIGRNESSDGPGGTGVVNLNGASGTLNMRGHNLQIGYGRNGDGTLTLGSGYLADIGSSAVRTNMSVGRREGGGALASTATGLFTMNSGSTVTGAANEFKVGWNFQAAGSADGTLDWQNATIDPAGFDATPEFRIGAGLDATGLVKLGSGGNFLTNFPEIGDSNSGGELGGTGTVELYGTQFHVNNELRIRASGFVDAKISGPSSGISMLNTAAGQVVIDNHLAALDLNFDDPNFTPTVLNPYWGFRWKGSNLADAGVKAAFLDDYVNDGIYTGDGRINVSIVGGSTLNMADLTIGTFTDGDGDWAFIGFTNFAIPEPSSALLLGIGAMLLVRRRRQLS